MSALLQPSGLSGVFGGLRDVGYIWRPQGYRVCLEASGMPCLLDASVKLVALLYPSALCPDVGRCNSAGKPSWSCSHA